MRFAVLLSFALALPAAAHHHVQEAMISFFALLPVAMIYGPDFGLRLRGSYPNALGPRCLVTCIVALSWSAFLLTTWVCASLFELGMEAGGFGLVACNFAGGLTPWLAARWFPFPAIAPALD